MTQTSVGIAFAEILGEAGSRIHVGIVMALGPDWVEVSCPPGIQLSTRVLVRFPPVPITHDVTLGWRDRERVGLAFHGSPPPRDQFTRLSLLFDPTPSGARAHARG